MTMTVSEPGGAAGPRLEAPAQLVVFVDTSDERNDIHYERIRL